MKKFIISEEEKNNILSLHSKLGYKTSLVEQNVAQQPQANVQKPKETLFPYFQSDPIGVKINQKSPAFAKWVSDSEIQPYKAKFNFFNEHTLVATGTDGKQYYLNLNYFDNPQSFVGASGKSNEIRQKLVAKINELNPQMGPYGSGTIKEVGCFNLSTATVNHNTNNRECRDAIKTFNNYKTQLGGERIGMLANFEKFASVAPKQG